MPTPGYQPSAACETEFMQLIIYFIPTRCFQVCFKVSFGAHGNADKERLP